MIKSKIVELITNTPEYPCLMYNENIVALFRAKEDGMVVHRLTENSAQVGTVLSRLNCIEDKFTVFNGKIELSNKL